MTDLALDAATTALVVLDVQNFVVGLPTVPLDGRAVLANAVKLADECRRNRILTVLVRVDSGRDNALLLKPPSDVSMPKFELPPGAHDFVPEIGPKPEDIIVTKHSWGAFHETDLDTHLRRRGMKTLIVAGFTTNYAVESTARQAHERGYAQIIVSDAMATFSLAEHEHPLKTIFPRIARIRITDQVLAALASPKPTSK